MPDIPHSVIPPSISGAQLRAGLLLSRGSAPLGRLKGWLDAALDLVLPPRCAGCGRVDTYWCDRCAREIDALPLLGAVPAIEGLAGSAATAVHEGKLQEAVQALKYDNARPLAAVLARRLDSCLRHMNWTFDMIVPVPLHTTRLRERGYNQSQLLGEHVAQLQSIPCTSSALRRWRSTATQVGLSGEQRRANVSDAFRAESQAIHSQSILLIDDVTTTGATLQACALALYEAGARAVYSITVTVARA